MDLCQSQKKKGSKKMFSDPIWKNYGYLPACFAGMPLSKGQSLHILSNQNNMDVLDEEFIRFWRILNNNNVRYLMVGESLPGFMDIIELQTM